MPKEFDYLNACIKVLGGASFIDLPKSIYEGLERLVAQKEWAWLAA